jgi:hypothetical protein
VNAEQCSQLLRAGGAKFSFDTNALHGDKRLTDLCDDVARWNVRLEQRGLLTVQLAVCAVAHAEKLFDLKQKHRADFDPKIIIEGLQSKGLLIEPFEVEHALETANRLGLLYDSSQKWRHAKRERCRQCLGLASNLDVPGTGKQCGATVDWLIGAHAHAQGYILVTDDRGPEMQGLERINLDALVEAVRQVLSEPA